MVLALAAVLLAEPAAGLRLDWQAPAGCPDGAALRARVVTLVGAEAAAQARLAARAVVRPQAGRWALELDLLRPGGQDRRTLADADCHALGEAAALVIAVAIDPQAGLGAPVLEDRPQDPPGPDAELVPTPPGGGDPPGAAPDGAVPGDRSSGAVAVAWDRPAPVADEADPVAADGADPAVAARAPAAGRRLQLGLRLGVGLGFARVLPGPHAALDLGLGLEGRGWRAELAGSFVPPVRGVAASDPGIGGVFRLGAGELRGCGMPGPRARPLVFPLCVGLQLGAMHGRGDGPGLPVQQAARALWAATRLGAALRWRPRGGRVGLWIGVDAIVALTRPGFVTAGGVRVHEAARVGGQAGVGVEVRLR